MLVTLLIILGSGVLLGAVGFLFARKRRTDASTTGVESDGQSVVPLLYMPRPRNTSEGAPAFGSADRTAVRAPKSPPIQPKYIAPLSEAGHDGTLQLLPGRLVPMGDDVGHEIRFIKTPGVNRFTFGRSVGPATTHIQLLAKTASRMHAYMIVENGRWRIGNMSETNRVLVNGVPLESQDADRWLEDGDRIELGEVGFIFRER